MWPTAVTANAPIAAPATPNALVSPSKPPVSTPAIAPTVANAPVAAAPKAAIDGITAMNVPFKILPSTTPQDLIDSAMLSKSL